VEYGTLFWAVGQLWQVHDRGEAITTGHKDLCYWTKERANLLGRQEMIIIQERDD
jgi:hypothetical protein